MTYTKTERANLAKAFRAAKNHLAAHFHQRGSAFICFALDHAYNKGQIDAPTVEDAKYLIASRMGMSRWDTYEDWLKAHHPAHYDILKGHPHGSSPQAYKARQAWLTSLIKEFSA